MLYHKYLWVVGIIFIIVGFMGINQGKLFSGLGFFPMAIGIFVTYDKNDPNVKNPKLRDAIFFGGMLASIFLWLLGPKLFPTL